MSVAKVFQVKWYHLLIGLLAILAVLLVLVWIMLAKEGPAYFVEDETDIVQA